jgi:hypothetical protein
LEIAGFPFDIALDRAQPADESPRPVINPRVIGSRPWVLRGVTIGENITPKRHKTRSEMAGRVMIRAVRPTKIGDGFLNL